MSETNTKNFVNAAAYLTASKARPLEVASAPYSAPGHGEVTVRNHAVAINPIDRLKQEKGNFLYSWLKYPAILGIDLAGEVVEVGKGVTRFKVGENLVNAVGTDAAGFRLIDHCPESIETVHLLPILTNQVADIGQLGFERRNIRRIGEP